MTHLSSLNTGFLLLFLVGPTLAADLPTLTQMATTSTDREADTQDTIERLDEEAQSAYAEYREKLIELEILQTYNRQLGALLEKQEGVLQQLDEQIKKTSTLDRDLIPLMERMHEALDTLVAQDLPFLKTERQQRLTRLRSILDNPELSFANRYRSMHEAYQIELDYGRTLETYEDTLDMDGQTLQATFLRIGRLALFAVSADRATIHQWDMPTQQWLLTDGLQRNIEKAIRMAKKQIAPNLLELPVQAPEAAR